MNRIVFSIILLISSCQPCFASIKIGAGQSAGLYYTTAAYLCTIFTKEFNEKCEVIVTSGSKENVELLNSKKVDIALVQESLVPNKSTKIFKLYYEYLFILYKEDKTNLQDIFKLSYNIDKKSGSYSTIESVLKTLNIPFTPSTSQNLKTEFDDFCYSDSAIRIYHIGFPSDLIETTLLQCSNVKIYSLNKSEKEILEAAEFSIYTINYLHQSITTIATPVYLIGSDPLNRYSKTIEKYKAFLKLSNPHLN